jgi:hypothetical protein
MLLSFRFLNGVANVNVFDVASSIEIAQGDTQDLYVQLIDASLDRIDQGFNPSGRRYMPATGATMNVTFTNTDTGPSITGDFALSPRINPSVQNKFTRAAVQPFPGDSSIWKVSLLASDPLNGTVQMKVVLTEPSRTLTAAQLPGTCLRVR